MGRRMGQASRSRRREGDKQRAAKWLMFSKLLNFWPKLAGQRAHQMEGVGEAF